MKNTVCENLLEKILCYLTENHPGSCRRWFKEIKAVSLDRGIFTLLAPRSAYVGYLQKTCGDIFNEAAQGCTGNLLVVQFIDSSEDFKKTAFNHFVTQNNEQILLSPDNTFENFIVGPDNQFAHAASFAVGKNPSENYNPLFIYGGVGLGKTHLLQAICHEIIEKNKDIKIFFTSCSDFMTSFVDAVQGGKMVDFRNRFRNYDVLVVDDIHDLSQRDRTQEEFFHTFNSLFQSKKQIILSSDAAPSEIPHLEERLVSRFSCGLVARVDKPGFETRIAIIKQKALIRNICMPEDVVNYIAARVDSNIREIEGAITSIQAMLLFKKDSFLEINLDLAKKALGQSCVGSKENSLNIQFILESVSDYYGLKISDMLSKKRHQSIATPRQIGMWFARQLTRHSLEEIGGYFGGRDHTTVMHAIKSVDKKQQIDKTIKKEINDLEKEFNLSRNISTK